MVVPSKLAASYECWLSISREMSRLLWPHGCTEADSDARELIYCTWHAVVGVSVVMSRLYFVTKRRKVEGDYVDSTADD
jgi:hypothetical protein